MQTTAPRYWVEGPRKEAMQATHVRCLPENALFCVTQRPSWLTIAAQLTAPPFAYRFFFTAVPSVALGSSRRTLAHVLVVVMGRNSLKRGK